MSLGDVVEAKSRVDNRDVTDGDGFVAGVRITKAKASLCSNSSTAVNTNTISRRCFRRNVNVIVINV